MDWIIRDKSLEKKAVFFRFDSGNPEDAMYVYLNKKNIYAIGSVDFLYQFGNRKDLQLYFVSRSNQLGRLENKMQELIRFNKPFGSEYLGVYQINNLRM